MSDVNHQAPSRPLSRDEFASLFTRDRRTLRVIAAAEVGRTDADDVLQEAAMSAMAKLHDFTPGTNFKAWMAAFVRYSAANHRRADTRRRRKHRRLADLNTSGTGDEPISDLDDALTSSIDQLTADQRSCLLLKVVLSHSYQDIEAILGIPATTARSHVFRARQRLHELMSGKEAQP